MNIKKIAAGVGAFALSITITSFAIAAEQSGNINLEVNVQETLSMDCYDTAGVSGDTTVTLGTSATPGVVVAGTPAVGGSTCNIVTNDDNGYYLTLVSATGTHNTATDVLQHEDPNLAGVWYDISDAALPEWDWNGTVGGGSVTTGNAAWVSGYTGLGFAVQTIPAGETTNNALNAVSTEEGACGEGIDGNLFSRIPESAEAISGVVTYQSGVTTTEVCYKVDVTAVQESGDYAGTVTYTATTDASTLAL